MPCPFGAYIQSHRSAITATGKLEGPL